MPTNPPQQQAQTPGDEWDQYVVRTVPAPSAVPDQRKGQTAPPPPGTSQPPAVPPEPGTGGPGVARTWGQDISDYLRLPEWRQAFSDLGRGGGDYQAMQRQIAAHPGTGYWAPWKASIAQRTSPEAITNAVRLIAGGAHGMENVSGLTPGFPGRVVGGEANVPTYEEFRAIESPSRTRPGEVGPERIWGPYQPGAGSEVTQPPFIGPRQQLALPEGPNPAIASPVRNLPGQIGAERIWGPFAMGAGIELTRPEPIGPRPQYLLPPGGPIEELGPSRRIAGEVGTERAYGPYVYGAMQEIPLRIQRLLPGQVEAPGPPPGAAPGTGVYRYAGGDIIDPVFTRVAPEQAERFTGGPPGTRGVRMPPQDIPQRFTMRGGRGWLRSTAQMPLRQPALESMTGGQPGPALRFTPEQAAQEGLEAAREEVEQKPETETKPKPRRRTK